MIDNHRLVSIEEGAFRGHLWAESSCHHLRQLMRRVAFNPEEARRKGERALRDMEKKFCPECVARLVLDELSRIQQRTTQEQEKTTTHSQAARRQPLAAERST
jgi:hypothetical protein